MHTSPIQNRMTQVNLPSKLEERIEGDPRIGLQVELELLYNKNQLVSRIRREFVDAHLHGGPDLHAYMSANEVDPDLGFEVLVQLVLHKRTTISTMVGILRHHVTPGVLPLADLQSVADMVLRCCEINLCDWSAVNSQLIIKHDISQDVQDELDRYQFPLPMVVKPRKLRRNTDSALVLTGDGGGSVILKDNHHGYDVCLDHLNRMNAVRFSLNSDTAHMVKNHWRSLDKPKIGETKADYERRVRAFEKYDRTAMDVISTIVSDFGDPENEEGNLFYLSHKYDKRGRTYCQGYHVNYQGTEWNKAVVELADKEIVP